MADLGNMELSVSADVSGLTGGLAKAESNMAKFGVAANKLAASSSGVEAGFKKITTGSNQAGFALQNLGRVAQDAPFGFIGIQNNLNPLLESFQRLRAETGSNAGALKALGSSLVGAGGIGLALSLVSSAVLLYQQYTQGATRETKKQEEAIQLSISTYDKFLQELEKTSEVAGKEAAKVSILFSALSDSNVGLRERKGIIEQLNQISPGYLGNLDKEKAGYAEIAKAVFAYSESLAKATEIKALLPQVDKLFQGLVNAQVQLNQLKRFGSSDKNFFGLSPEDLKTEEAKLLGVIKSFGNQIKIAKSGLSNFAGGDLNLSEILFGKTPELSKPAKEAKEKIEKAFKEIRFKPDYISKLFFDEATIKLAVPEQAELDFKKSLVTGSPLGGLNNILGEAAFAEVNARAVLAGAGITKGIQVGMNAGVAELRVPQLLALAKDFTEKFGVLRSNLQQIASNTLVDVFAGLGDTLGRALTDGLKIGDLFGGVFQLIGAGLKSMGKAMIEYGVGIIALKNAIKNPYLAIAAGVGLIALGAVLQSAIPKFAVGTQNFRGGMALVGERGPELVNLPKGSGVVPNDKLGGISGNGQQVFIPDVVMRGQDLVIVFNRANKNNSRAF